MHKTNVVHGVIGLVLQAAILIVTSNPWYGFALVSGIFWSREHNQKQANIAKQKKCTLNEIEWYEGGDMTQWSKDSLLDFFVPFIATLAVALAFHYYA